MPAKIAVIYYSATGNVHMLAEAIAEGAAESASEVRSTTSSGRTATRSGRPSASAIRRRS
jgi:flavodoxin